MAAEEDKGSRLDLARAQADALLARLAPEDRVRLVLAPPLEDDPRDDLARDDARAAVGRVTPIAAPAGLEPVVEAAAAESARAQTPPPVVVTDRVPSLAPEAAARTALVVVGSPLANRAIVALGSSRDAAGRETLLVAVANLSERPWSGKVRLRVAASADDLSRGVARDREVELRAPPSGLATATLPDDVVAGSGAASARILDRDALAADDEAFAVRARESLVRVALVGDLPPALARAARATPAAVVVEAPSWDVVRGACDLAFVAGPLPVDRGAESVVVYAPPDADDVTEPSGTAPLEARGLFEHSYEALRDEMQRGAKIAVARARPSPRDVVGTTLRPLLATHAGIPLVGYQGTRAPFIGYIGFDLALANTDWTSRPSFPIFVAEAIEAARGARTGTLECTPTGRPVESALAHRGPVELVALASGARRRAQAPLVLREASLFRATSGGDEETWGAGLLDPRASDLRGASPRAIDPALLSLVLGPPRVEESRASVSGGAAALALLFALLAWRSAR
jgi:hypothetical protein